MSRGFGVAAGLDPEVARPLAARCAELGYDSIWSNDHPAPRGWRRWPSSPRRRRRLDLGVAVIALDRTPPEEIAADIERLGLDPLAALARRRRRLLGEAADEDARVAAGAARDAPRRSAWSSPRWGRRCARSPAPRYDGAFFNWMTPEFAAGAREKVEAGAAEAGREAPPVFGYVRTAVGPDAAERLAKEESFYRDLHDGYRNHFDRLGEPEGTVGVAAASRDDAQAQLAAYTALDTVVVRGLASANVEAMTAVAEAAAPVAACQYGGRSSYHCAERS